MPTPINARDILLQQLNPRVLNITSNHITLVSPNVQAVYYTTNTPTPSTIEITAVLAGGLTGTVTFEITTGLLPNTTLVLDPNNPNKLLLDPQSFSGNSVSVTAKLTFQGVEYVSVPIVVSRIYPNISARITRTVDNIPASITGTNYTLPSSNTLELYNGNTKFTTGVTFGPATQTQSGLTCNVNTTTGVVTLTQAAANSWTTDSVSFNLTATLGLGVTYTVTYTITKIKEGGTGLDPTPPPTPTNFQATAFFTSILIQHDLPSYTQGHGHYSTVVYGRQVTPQETNTLFNSAEILAEFFSTSYSLPVDPNTTWRLWIKLKSNDRYQSSTAAGGTNGIVVTTAQSVENLLDALTGELTESQLSNTLTSRIDLIDDPTTGLISKTNSLINTLGITLSAEQSANSAELSKNSAILAQQLATEQAQLATSAKDTANNFATDALISSTSAAQSVVTAQGAATTAIEQSQLATAAKNEAGLLAADAAISSTSAAQSVVTAQSAASTATSQANLATTASNNASGFATTAGVSASNAATSATNASGSAQSAASALQQVTATVENISLGKPLEQWTLNGQTIVTLTDGKVGNTALRLAGPGNYPNQGNYIPLDRTKKYKTKFWARPSSNNTTGQLWFSLRQFTDNVGSPGPLNSGRSPVKFGRTRAQHIALYGDTWGEYSYTWVAADWQTGVTYIQPEFFDNYVDATGYWDIQAFSFTDVTDTDAISATVQTLATTVAGTDGATAQYTVKTDVNGYVAGFGLSSTSNTAGGATSEFTIVADKFAIAPVNTSNTAVDGSPFFHRTAATTINGVTVPAGTYMKSAFIHDATISTAKIQDAAITSAKIEDLAVGSAKIDDLAVTTGKIANLAVTSAQIDNLTIGRAKLSALAATDKQQVTTTLTQVTPSDSVSYVDLLVMEFPVTAGTLTFIEVDIMYRDGTLINYDMVDGDSHELQAYVTTIASQVRSNVMYRLGNKIIGANNLRIGDIYPETVSGIRTATLKVRPARVNSAGAYQATSRAWIFRAVMRAYTLVK